MRTILQDVRFAARVLRRRLGFTAAAIICLTLGIGATTAIFSVVNSVIMRPLPYRQPDRLVRLYSEFPTFPNGGLRKFWISPPEFIEIRRDSRAWESIDAWVNSGVNLAGNADPVRATASFVSGSLLRTLGVQPFMGRLLSPQDDLPESPQTAVISYGLWQRTFGGDRNILNRDLRVNGEKCTIVGVMPPGFQFPPGEVDAPELWAPLQINPASPGGRGSHYLYLLGRLKDGISFEQGRQDAARLVDTWGKLDAPKTHHMHPKFHPMLLSPLHEEVVASVRPAMLMMLAAVGFVLLIACVNVANLLLARAEGRQREVAIRRAMGAGRASLLRQLIVEGVLLSLSGAILGLAAAYAGLRVIVATSQGSIPRNAEIGVDIRVLLFTLAISVLTGLFFGLAPLAQHLAQSLHDSLKAAGGRTTATVHAHRLRNALVVAELGIALVLLIASGLMVRTFWKLQAVNIGVRPDNVLTMRISLPEGMYKQDGHVLQLWANLLDRVRILPGVQSATMMTGMPPIRPLNANDTQIEGYVQRQGGPLQNVDFYQTAGPKFFETMGIPLIEGRLFEDRDGANAPATIIVNQTLARTFWPGQSAIGHRIRPGFEDPWRTVVGVVGDVKNAGIDKPTGTELFLPAAQTGGQTMRNGYILVRSDRDPRALAGSIRAQVEQLDSGLPVANIRTMEEVISAAQSRPRFLTLLLSLFSAVALVLASVGIYGVMSYMVAQRTSEIGIRMAIGAKTNDVLGLVVGRGMRIGIIGVAFGAAGALLFTRLMKGLLYGVDSLDPMTFGTMAVVLVAVILLACYIPARRAAKVDPVVALRYE